MFRKATVALAVMLVLGSLSVARAEDPDEDMLARSHSAVERWRGGPDRHAALAWGADRRRPTYQR